MPKDKIFKKFSSCFCCLKCTAKKVVLKPPSPPFYEVLPIETRPSEYILKMSSEVDTSGMMKIMKQDVRFIKTTLGNDIVVLFLTCSIRARYTLIYSHGRSTDIGQMHSFCAFLSFVTGCDIVTYDYSGYGHSEGKPSEENLYEDIRAAWNYALTRPNPENIILYGQDIGATATLDLASKVSCAGVILHAPIASTVLVVCYGKPRSDCISSFNSAEKARKVTCPVLVIHGTNDEVNTLSHGKTLHKLCSRAVEPLWIQGAAHNNLHVYGQYEERLRKFINEELSD
ncbi:alpha/beta hydrolase domain-containing protein 17B-like [Stegodyphus dumicola]|uniref:alpha/beta hydrolase domain-containing protein 17B-like n=1 Tax=Stegodyphus dumicola TaxID=202533 RepID=UPI0015B24293|nr:alpha/beta hydrolase domain-containing protein 17B-like [Stegodyphus dumicola]